MTSADIVLVALADMVSRKNGNTISQQIELWKNMARLVTPKPSRKSVKDTSDPNVLAAWLIYDSYPASSPVRPRIHKSAKKDIPRIAELVKKYGDAKVADLIISTISPDGYTKDLCGAITMVQDLIENDKSRPSAPLVPEDKYQ